MTQQRETGDRQPKLGPQSFHIRKSKRATIYFEPKVHRKVRLEAAQTGRSISDIVNEITAMALGVETSASLRYEQVSDGSGYVKERGSAFEALVERVEHLEEALRGRGGKTDTDRETGTAADTREDLSGRPALSRDQIFSELRDKRSRLQAFGVERIGLFGSFKRGTQTDTSDIDFLVEFMDEKKTFDNFMNLAQFLEELFERKVELITPESLSPYLGPNILKEVEYVIIGE